MNEKPNQKEYFDTIETPKQIRDEIVKDLECEIKRRKRDLENDVFLLSDAMRGRN